MSKVTLQAVRSAIVGLAAFAALVFLPAWTLDYWQAWVFLAVFVAASVPVSAYIAIRDPKLFERRLNAGPTAEQTPAQKVILSFALAAGIALLVVPSLDHRFGWSDVPPAVCVAGDVLIALSYLCFFFVFRENSWGASTIQVVEGQPVISTGPYAVVRHPMYSGVLIMLVGIPLALGSWWGLLVVPVAVLGLVWRLLDEESFLSKNLPGYPDYLSRVRWRLVPGIY